LEKPVGREISKWPGAIGAAGLAAQQDRRPLVNSRLRSDDETSPRASPDRCGTPWEAGQMRTAIFAPVLALVLWTFVMWVWLYATRIPALSRHRIVYDPAKPNEAFNAQLPPRVRWKADNYNNLMEQPPVFYAVSIVLALSDAGYGVNVWLAWAYVGVRVAHSLVHALANIALVRFALFALGSAILFGLTVRAALVVF
jgi:hypothetical protein